MIKRILTLSVAVILSGCGGGGGGSDSESVQAIIKPKSESTILVIPFTYDNASETLIPSIGGANIDTASRIEDMFVNSSSDVYKWIEWASAGKHKFSSSSESLDWRTLSDSVPPSNCGSDIYYAGRKLIPKLNFSDAEKAKIRAAGQVMVLGFGDGNCMSNASFKENESLIIGGISLDNVVYVDLDQNPLTKQGSVRIDIKNDTVYTQNDATERQLVKAQMTFIHEYLHTFGIGHAGGDQKCAASMVIAGSCSFNNIINNNQVAYEDEFDIMGNRNIAYGLNAVNRYRLGWLAGSLGTLTIDGPTETLSTINDGSISGYKALKLVYKGKTFYFSNVFQHEDVNQYDNSYYADMNQSDKTSGSTTNPNIQAYKSELDGVFIHMALVDSYHMQSTKLIAASGDLNAGFLQTSHGAFMPGDYQLAADLNIHIAKVIDGQFTVNVTSN